MVNFKLCVIWKFDKIFDTKFNIAANGNLSGQAISCIRWLTVIITGALFLAPFLNGNASAETDNRWQYPQQYSMSPKSVNLQTGRFIYTKTDLVIGDLTLSRHWGDVPSFSWDSRAFGLTPVVARGTYVGYMPPNAGWSHNFLQGVYFCPGCGDKVRASVIAGGKVYTFDKAMNQDDVYLPTGQSVTGTSLAFVNGQWSFIDRSGNNYTFANHPALVMPAPIGNRMQLLQSVTYADGARVDYSYNNQARPKLVRSNRGYAVSFEYDANGNISKTCGFNATQAVVDINTSCSSSALVNTYAYNVSGQFLNSVENVNGIVVSMNYAISSGIFLPTCISLPNIATCELENTFGAQPGDGTVETYDDQVRRQTTANGDVWTYKYLPPADSVDLQPGPQTPVFSSASVTSAGTTTALKFDRGRLIRQQTAGNQTLYRYRTFSAWSNGGLSLLYFDDANPGLIIRPEGNMEYYEFDARSNMVAHSYWPKGSPNLASTGNYTLDQCCMASSVAGFPAGSLTYRRTFLPDNGLLTLAGTIRVIGCGTGIEDSKLCDKPLSVTDPKLGTTDYTYAPEHGGVLTETGPAGANGIRPQTRYAYAQREAWLKTSTGSYAKTGQPIWLLERKSSCKTTAAVGNGCAGGAADELVTLYDYGPDVGPSNLNLMGIVEDANGAALRTCYGYDWRGNKISTSAPRAGLTTCP